MVREINGLGGMPGNTKSTDQSGRKTAENAPDARRNDAGQPSDGVQLSAEARSLQSLSDRVQGLPDANLERAEQIRQALESGEYRIDDVVVADKLLQSEALLDN